MAKYTELLQEYVDGGGVLPSASFALIPDFEDLFLERYCNCEIGFETESIFALKLDYKARAVMPEYAKRYAALITQYGQMGDGLKWRYNKRTYGKQHTAGESTILPFNATTAEPSGTTSADFDEHTDEDETKESFTPDEHLRVIEEFSRKMGNVIDACLDEFKPLFMGVY